MKKQGQKGRGTSDVEV